MMLRGIHVTVYKDFIGIEPSSDVYMVGSFVLRGIKKVICTNYLLCKFSFSFSVSKMAPCIFHPKTSDICTSYNALNP